MIVNVGDIVSFKRMGSSADMSLGKVLAVAYDKGYPVLEPNKGIYSVTVQFTTKKHIWDKETRRWKEGTFIRTIKNLKGMEIINA